MPVYKRQEIGALLAAVRRGEAAPVYLIFGERFLGRNFCDQLLAELLPEPPARETNIESLDGESEDPARLLHLLKTYSLFPGRRVLRVLDCDFFHSRAVSKTLWEKAEQAYEAGDTNRALSSLRRVISAAGGFTLGEIREWPEMAPERWREIFGFAKPSRDLTWAHELLQKSGETAFTADQGREGIGDELERILRGSIPANNILVLVAETVDKRKRLFKYLEQEGVVVDLTVGAGSTSAARQDQEAVLQGLISETLAGLGKKIERRAMEALLERVGFHPTAIVQEAEKVGLYADDEQTVSLAHVDAVVGRTREEALFELTEAVGSGNVEQSVRILSHLREHGIHSLVILATVRNFLRKLLLIRSYQDLESPLYRRGVTFPAFSKGYLPQLKECRSGSEVLAGHPYAVYKLFSLAEQFSAGELIAGLAATLEAEHRLKGSAVPDWLVMEHLLLELTRKLKIADGPPSAYGS